MVAKTALSCLFLSFLIAAAVAADVVSEERWGYAQQTQQQQQCQQVCKQYTYTQSPVCTSVTTQVCCIFLYENSSNVVFRVHTGPNARRLCKPLSQASAVLIPNLLHGPTAAPTPPLAYHLNAARPWLPIPRPAVLMPNKLPMQSVLSNMFRKLYLLNILLTTANHPPAIITEQLLLRDGIPVRKNAPHTAGFQYRPMKLINVLKRRRRSTAILVKLMSRFQLLTSVVSTSPNK